MLKFATDCSGVDSPLYALKLVLRSSNAESKIDYVFASEIDAELRRVLSEQAPKPRIIFDDIANRDNEEFVDANIDLYVAGFPCQSFSCLGNELGFVDGPRGEVFFHIHKFITQCQPKVFVLENVAHLVRHNEGKTFEQILRILR